ncbi:MAG: hypothetical protein Q8922_13375 [Bacteroidota bacterium]|nr:hypothetical protein [Bacteroidota bacterium]MDP4233875.1 hypothetical protein [Bacteroidota bacterium]MDP4243548.1 hypothetical protein [Bacteroidota bacterium]MDP4288913.1 hypothetical protein [Bacteroidota bacterium]
MNARISWVEDQYYQGAFLNLFEDELRSAYAATSIDQESRARCAFLLGICSEGDLTACSQLYNEAHGIALVMRDDRLLADSFHGQAYVAFRVGDLKRSYEYEQKSLQHAIASHHEFRISFTYYMLGIIALRFGHQESGLAYLKQGLLTAKRNGCIRLLALLHTKNSELRLLSNDLDGAKLHAEEAIRFASSIGADRNVQEARIKLASVELELASFERVAELVIEVRAHLAESDFPQRCVTHTLMGKVHEAKRRYEKAEIEFKTAIKLADYPNAERVRSNVHVHMAELYLKTKKVRPALKEALAALADAEKAQDIYVRKEALRSVHDAYKALNKYKEAHEYLEQYNALVAESDAALLKSRLEYHALKSDFEQEKAKADMQTQQTELLRIKLEYKERELTEKMRHLITQAEAVRQFRNDLRSLLRRTPSDDPAAKDIRSRLSSFTESDIQWQEFEEKFREAYPDFREKLKAKHPDLTGQELRLCQLLRAGLKSVEAAKLMSISERGVEQHRFRIRRKVGLKGKESLSEYLQQL